MTICQHRRTEYSPTLDARVCLDCGDVRVLKQGKYHSNRTTVDGITFPSEREANRWLVLRDMERRGEISDLCRQVRYPLAVNGVPVCVYVSDFDYVRNGRRITEDAKGMATQLYRQKKALMRAVYGIEVLES